ncbi:MAG: type 4a pilus biogenesis protein PilO [Candidatus Moraniibacteriota bacterium]
MSSLKILIVPLSVILSILTIWMFIKPLYEETRKLDKIKKVEMESLVQQENDLQQRANKLYDESENGNQKQLVLSALPVDKNSKDLVAQLENIVRKEKMSLAAISIEDSAQSKQSTPGILGQTGNAYQEMAGKIEVKGSYGQFKQLLKDVRKLERIVNISQLSIKNATNEDGEGAIGRYSLSFNTYWQPETTAEQVKAGLESREFSSN